MTTTPIDHQCSTSDPNRSFAIWSFALGLASIVLGWTFFAPITGFILGSIALRRGTSERTLALWGVWINGVILALVIIGIILVTAMIAVGSIAFTLNG